MNALQFLGVGGAGLVRLALGAWLTLLISGCAGVGTPAADEYKTIVTASDQTDAGRRAQVRMELAGAYFARGQFETALDEVKMALVASPNNGDAFNLRGLILGAMGEDRLAEESFRRALQLSPRDGGTLHNLGWFHCQRGRFAQAQAQFNAALALNNYRDAGRTWLASGLCYGRDQQWLKAETALMRAFEQDPGNPSIAFTLAEVLYREGNHERARFYIARVNGLPEATNAQSLWLAARIEHRMGNATGARQFGERLRSQFPKSAEALKLDSGRFDD